LLRFCCPFIRVLVSGSISRSPVSGSIPRSPTVVTASITAKERVHARSELGRDKDIEVRKGRYLSQPGSIDVEHKHPVIDVERCHRPRYGDELFPMGDNHEFDAAAVVDHKVFNAAHSMPARQRDVGSHQHAASMDCSASFASYSSADFPAVLRRDKTPAGKPKGYQN
jgi:hypothetical protein